MLRAVERVMVEYHDISGSELRSNDRQMRHGARGDFLELPGLRKRGLDAAHDGVAAGDEFERRAIDADTIEWNPNVQAVAERIGASSVGVSMPADLRGVVFAGLYAFQERVPLAEEPERLGDKSVEGAHNSVEFCGVNSISANPSIYGMRRVPFVSLIEDAAKAIDIRNGYSGAQDFVPVGFNSHHPSSGPCQS